MGGRCDRCDGDQVVSVFRLLGVCDGVAGGPTFVGIPGTFATAAQARSALGAVMVLSRMVHGDVVADSTSWYLQTALIGSVPPDEGPAFLGYVTNDGTRYPVAGGWRDGSARSRWRAFVEDVEGERSHNAGFPWRPSTLVEVDVLADEEIDWGFLRITPGESELLVRPLHISTTEPLF